MSTLTFLGATGTVTGSKYLLEAGGERLLIDCGLFQGEKELRLRNWNPLPIPASSIQWLVLTHAHLDHTGYIPRLVTDGFNGQIYGSPAPVDLSKLVLPDSGHLQEEDAAYANKKGFSKHDPALPLYTYDEAVKSLELFRAIDESKPLELSTHFALRCFAAGHILGARMIEVTVRENMQKRQLPLPGGNPAPKAFIAPVTQYQRDTSVKGWVLKQAQGICECCRQPAPFEGSDGRPYLEVHHVRQLAEQGPDTPANTVAVCPNCHRELHYGRQAKELVEALYQTVDRLRR